MTEVSLPVASGSSDSAYSFCLHGNPVSSN